MNESVQYWKISSRCNRAAAAAAAMAKIITIIVLVLALVLMFSLALQREGEDKSVPEISNGMNGSKRFRCDSIAQGSSNGNSNSNKKKAAKLSLFHEYGGSDSE